MDLCKDVECKEGQQCVVQSKDSALCVDKPKRSDPSATGRQLTGRKKLRQDQRTEDPLLEVEKSLQKVGECKPCSSAARTNFYCGSDNSTYASLCRLRFHNCVHDLSVRVACKGFCPCGADVTRTRKSNGNSKPHSVTLHKDLNLNSVLIRGDARNFQRRVCDADELKITRERLIDWFAVILSEQKSSHRRLNSDTLSFPDCPPDTSNIFLRLDLNNDMKLSPKELFDLEYDNHEKCIKQYIDSCDEDKDGYISPYEWCTCFDQKGRVTELYPHSFIYVLIFN